MSELRGACIIGQSGGPTAVINASALGAIEAALDSGVITKVLAAQYGIKGVLYDRLFDCGAEDREELHLLLHTPSSALGSCRYKLKDSAEDETDYKRILEIFKKYDVRYFFYNGGNDSMDTCNKVSKYMQRVGYECRIMGIPKTVDNDLWGTDHCPGYPSAARYIAFSTAEVSRDNKVYDAPSVVILEIMGRHAGWLTAASSLASVVGEGPDLVYLPETDFSIDSFIEDVKAVAEKKRSVIIALSEGVRTAEGKLILDVLSESTAKDAFGHTQLGGVGLKLAGIVKQRTGFKTRSIEFSLLQRCSAALASGTDVEESYASGAEAVKQAIAGNTDMMIGFERPESGAYKCRLIMIPLAETANAEKKIPREWINEAGNGMKDEFTQYGLPLIQGAPELSFEKGLPRYAKLKKVFVK